MRIQIGLITIFLGLSACNLMQRSTRSWYYKPYESNQDVYGNFYEDRQILEVDRAKDELGLDFGRQLTAAERSSLSQRLALKRLEAGLNQDRERKQYYSYKPYFPSDRERIKFLRIPSLQARPLNLPNFPTLARA